MEFCIIVKSGLKVGAFSETIFGLRQLKTSNKSDYLDTENDSTLFEIFDNEFSAVVFLVECFVEKDASA